MDRRRLLSALRIALAVLVTAAVVFAVAKNWTEVSADLRRMDVGTVALAGFLGCLPPLLTLFAWRRLLAELGSPIHMAPAGGIFFVGQLGKYVPGSVWAIVAQAEMAARLHVPRRRTAVTGLLNVGLAAVCGFIVGFPSLPLLLSRKATSTRCSSWCCGRGCSTGPSRSACGCCAASRSSTSCPGGRCCSPWGCSCCRGCARD
jgi:hypothetical protein